MCLVLHTYKEVAYEPIMILHIMLICPNKMFLEVNNIFILPGNGEL